MADDRGGVVDDEAAGSDGQHMGSRTVRARNLARLERRTIERNRERVVVLSGARCRGDLQYELGLLTDLELEVG